ncbi:MAG: MFS transporter [Candidatus Bathyarchaeota archaeon]|jgi:MFS family permease
MVKTTRPSGMFGFTIIWIGQLISLLGTAMTGFALTIWAWQITGKATALALVGFFTFVPTLAVTPFAGVLIDRWNRKLVMMLSDLAAITSTTAVLLLYSTGNLQVWHLYVTGAFAGAFGAFQFPAYSAAITTMVPKDQFGRASGMLSTAQFASNIFAPALAAIFLSIIGIAGILTIDMFTFLVAIGALLAVHVPQPVVSQEGQKSRGSLLAESAYGFRYIYARKGLFALLLIFFCVNLLAPFAFTLLAPMILARTGNNERILGLVQSAIGVGGLMGGLAISIWGGPKRRIHGTLIGLILVTMGMLMIGLGQTPLMWVIAAFFTIFFVPIINGSNQAIWQSKVAPDVQGRVFASRAMIAQLGAPASMLIGGVFADNIFEPMMMPGGSGVPLFGWLVGTGPGAGMSLMFIIAGALGILVGLGGYALPIVRNVEDILPDHIQDDKSSTIT